MIDYLIQKIVWKWEKVNNLQPKWLVKSCRIGLNNWRLTNLWDIHNNPNQLFTEQENQWHAQLQNPSTLLSLMTMLELKRRYHNTESLHPLDLFMISSQYFGHLRVQKIDLRKNITVDRFGLEIHFLEYLSQEVDWNSVIYLNVHDAKYYKITRESIWNCYSKYNFN